MRRSHDLFDLVLQALASVRASVADALELGRERRRLDEVLEVLEVFPEFVTEPEPHAVALAAARTLAGRLPDVAGRVLLDTLEPVHQ